VSTDRIGLIFFEDTILKGT